MGEAREAVATCGDQCCALWRYRPYQPGHRKTATAMVASGGDRGSPPAGVRPTADTDPT